MEISAKEQNHALTYFKHKGIGLNEIECFSFMQRYVQDPERHCPSNLYGPGLLTLTLKSGRHTVCTLHPRNHPTAVIRTLVSQGIRFENVKAKQPVSSNLSYKKYYRPSLYTFWHYILFISCFIMTLYLPVYLQNLTGLCLALPFLAGTLYTLHLLLTRFCYLTLDHDSISIHSAGRTIRYPYTHVLKINFDFSTHPNSTHVMELLDTTYRYRLFYIGGTPRRSLNEIAGLLTAAGIDATCSLNDEKWHYEDVYHG